MYISNNCRDYNASITSRELMYVLDNNIYTKLNKKDGNFIYQLNADDKTIPVNKDEDGRIYYNKNAITGKKIDTCYDNCYIIENDKLFYLDNNKTLCAYDNAISEKLDLNYFNKLNIHNCFKFYEGNIITYEGLEGFKMYNNKGELLWGFYNQNMFIDPFGKTHGSDTFYNEFIIYKGYIIVASCIGNMIFKIKINGNDFEYLGINSLNFVIIDDMICYKDNYDLLNNLNLKTNVNEKTNIMIEHDKNLYAVGNRIITIIDKKICLVNPITFNIFNLCKFDENNFTDIATYNNYIFIKTNNDKIYKIPKFILQIGNFDIKEYCYYDFETTSIEDLWEI